MKTHNLTFCPDGAVHCLWTEAIPLQELGQIAVQRASTIEFDPAQQVWEVRLTSSPQTVAYSHVSREKCLDWERQALQ